MSPLQFVTRERIARAQQLIRSGSCRSAQPHRDRARSRLHEPESFWSSLPVNGWRHADRVSQRLVSHRPSGSDFSARTRHVAHDHESSVARMYDGAIAPEWFGCTTTPHKNKPIGASKHMHQLTYNAKAYSAASPTSGLASTKIQRREPTDRDVQIEILFCGICHSDLHSVRNEWSEFMATNYPIVPGHEIIGRVTKVGSAVTKYKPGDLAAVGCMVDSDGTCPQCKAGLEQFCPNMILTFNSPDKHLGGVTYGGYSDSIVVDEHFVLRVPSNLDLAAAAPLLCAGITIYSGSTAILRWPALPLSPSRFRHSASSWGAAVFLALPSAASPKPRRCSTFVASITSPPMSKSSRSRKSTKLTKDCSSPT